MPSKTLFALAFLIGVATLASCVSPEELRRRDEAACTGYGFAPGSPEFAACLQQEGLARQGGTGFSLGLGFFVGF
jgi:hypothetical protein